MRRIWAWIYGLYRYWTGRPFHCWAGNDDATCFLLHGHLGPHRWTPDREIVIHFPAKGGE